MTATNRQTQHKTYPADTSRHLWTWTYIYSLTAQAMLQGHLTLSRKKAGKTEWYPVIYPQIMPIMENTKMKVTSFDLYAIPNADDAQRCRIEIKWREQEAADGGDHFILCGRKSEWCRWDCTMSALINLLNTAYCAVGNVKEGRFGHIVAVIFGADW